MEKVDRARFLRLGAAGALGDDVGFFGFAVVAELYLTIPSFG